MIPKMDLPALTQKKAHALIERIDEIPLYAHAYAFHLNFRFGSFRALDLLDFAAGNKLYGVKIHMDDGEQDSLRNADETQRAEFRKAAKRLNLDIHLEISETELPSLRKAIQVGHDIGATSIRCYPRYEGRVSEIISRTIDDLSALCDLDPDCAFRFTLEQHEDLTGAELVRIVEAVDNPNLSLMFDFTNMINAYERPIDAFHAMEPHITDVHIKDAKIVEDRGGWGQLCCRSGDGDIPQAHLLMELLCLGENTPQVLAYGLEEEVGYYAPPLRFPDEEDDPFISYRNISETDLAPDANLASLLIQERADAQHLCTHIQDLLKLLRDHAASYL